MNEMAACQELLELLATDMEQQISDENVEVTKEETRNVEDSDVTSGSGKRRSKRKLSKSPPAGSDSQKKHKLRATEEALSIMKDIQVLNALKDQYTVFGDQVGMRIRDLATLNAKKIVKHLISNVLFEAEMGKYDNPNSYIPSDPPRPQERFSSGEYDSDSIDSVLMEL